MVRSGLFFAVIFIGAVLVASVSLADATFQGVGLYQSFEELNAWAADFEAANSDIVKVVEYGQSHQGRSLWAIKISRTPDADDPAKPEFLFTGGVHAREVIGSEASYRLAQYIAGGYRADDPAVLDILAEREVWILPNMNPDGRVRVEGDIAGDYYNHSQQRKTMQLFPGQNQNNYTRGVDLNRNFPHLWNQARSYVTSEQYRGPSTLSTPEANAFWFDLLKNPQYFSDIRAAIDFHSGIQSVLTPWVSSPGTIPAADRDMFLRLAGEMAKKGDGTIVGINTLGYSAYGTLTDSLYEEFGAYALCEELYKGPVPISDYFAYFNPVNQAGVDATVDHAIESSMFLLSDAAFEMVPEPTVLAMLFLGGIAVFCILTRS